MFKKKKKKRKRGGGALSRMHAADGASNESDEICPVVVTDGADAIQARKRRATAINSFGAKPAAKTQGGAATASASASDALGLNMFVSTRSAAPAVVAGGATAAREIDTAHDRDAVALEARRKREEEADTSTTDRTSGKVTEYKGAKSYKQWVRRRFDGPMRASSNVRTTARFDYDPSICKDYKETGTCGYGDSCIYLHDRSDYKSGWQIEQEWKDKERQRAKELLGSAAGDFGGDGDDGQGGTTRSGSSGSTLPFACFICRGPFVKPVKTICEHYFCEKCALQRFGKQKKHDCAVCGEPTKGNFSVAQEIIEDQKRRNAK